MKISSNFRTRINAGRFKVFVVDAKTQEIVEERPWQKNLILDSGLDRYGTTKSADCWRYCSVGTDNTPVVDDSGATTATQAGTTVTASASIFSAQDVGRLFKFDSGEESYITAFTSDTVIEVADSRTVGSPTQFAVWRVNQTQLGAYSKRTTTYFTSNNGCGTYNSGSDGVTLQWRTWDFAAETGNVTYREIGVHPDNVADDVLFARVLINGGAVSLGEGQQLRVRYEITIEFATDAEIAGYSDTLNITGWPAGGASTTDGTAQSTNIIYYGPSSTGSSTGYINETVLSNAIEPVNEPDFDTSYFMYSTSSAAIPAFGTDDDAALTALSIIGDPNSSYSKSTYVNGDFSRDATMVLGPSVLSSSTIRKIGFGDSTRVAWVFLFDENQQKLNTHRLTLTWRWSWARVIEANP